MSTSTSIPETTTVDISQFTHTPSFCEENVYLLCKKLCANGIAEEKGSDLFVVFISNEKKHIPLWHQKASGRADGVVLWDYHVICIQKKGENNSHDLVWDMDSSLPFPCPLARYVSDGIRPSFQLFSEFQRLYRIVHAPIYLKSFASDRRHMKDSAGDWIAQPPAYDAIVAEDGTVHNLNDYMDINAKDSAKDIAEAVNGVKTQNFGVVIGEDHLEDFFSGFP